MHATPEGVLTLSPSRGAALPALRGSSSLPPAVYRTRRGSPRPERSRIREDDGWLGATRQSGILAIHNSHNSHNSQASCKGPTRTLYEKHPIRTRNRGLYSISLYSIQLYSSRYKIFQVHGLSPTVLP